MANRVLLSLFVLFAAICDVYSLGGEEALVTLPFGDKIGDHLGPFKPDSVSRPQQLQGRYIFYGREESTLYISENGVISFREPFPEPFARPLPFSTDTDTPAIIAGFWGDISVQKNGGIITFREMDSTIGNRFCEAKACVLKVLHEGFGGSMAGFDPTHIFLVTWETVHDNDPGIRKRAVTFQIVLVTDSERTYAMLLYSDVRWNQSRGHDVLVGFNAGDGVRSFTHPLYTEGRILDLDFETNARRMGAFVYRIDQDEIIEPTESQKKENICDLEQSCVEEVVEATCTCSTEERPVLDRNLINCNPPPLTVELYNNTPAVEGDSVTVYVRSNKPDAQIYCQLLGAKKFKDTKMNCSSGMFHRSGLSPNTYSLRVVATTNGERTVLRTGFTIVAEKTPEVTDDFCAVTIINKGTAVKNGVAKVEFVGTEAVTQFYCRVDRTRNTLCTSPLTLEGLSPGRHRVVVVPRGCGRNRKASSIRFTVKN